MQEGEAWFDNEVEPFFIFFSFSGKTCGLALTSTQTPKGM